MRLVQDLDQDIEGHRAGAKPAVAEGAHVESISAGDMRQRPTLLDGVFQRLGVRGGQDLWERRSDNDVFLMRH